MLFAGDQDFIRNYMGIESVIQDMEWNGAKGLGTVKTETWTVDETPADTDCRRHSRWNMGRAARSYLREDIQLFSYGTLRRSFHFARHGSWARLNFSAIADGSTKIRSKVGDDEKPGTVKSPGRLWWKEKRALTRWYLPERLRSEDKAMWEAYYNAGSAALVLVLIVPAIGLFLFWPTTKNGQAQN